VEQNLRDWLEGQCVPWTIRIRPSGLSSYPEFVWSALGWSPPASKIMLDCLTESSFHLELTSQSYSKGTMITRPKASSNLIGGWNHVWYKSGGGTDFMTIVNTSIISLCIFLRNILQPLEAARDRTRNTYHTLSATASKESNLALIWNQSMERVSR
jgi:hypothetical protein